MAEQEVRSRGLRPPLARSSARHRRPASSPRFEDRSARPGGASCSISACNHRSNTKVPRTLGARQPRVVRPDGVARARPTARPYSMYARCCVADLLRVGASLNGARASPKRSSRRVPAEIVQRCEGHVAPIADLARELERCGLREPGSPLRGRTTWTRVAQQEAHAVRDGSPSPRECGQLSSKAIRKLQRRHSTPGCSGRWRERTDLPPAQRTREPLRERLALVRLALETDGRWQVPGRARPPRRLPRARNRLLHEREPSFAELVREVARPVEARPHAWRSRRPMMTAGADHPVAAFTNVPSRIQKRTNT